MKTENLNGMWGPLRAGFLFMMLICVGESALAAGTSSNAILENFVTVDYQSISGGATLTAEASVAITVTLVATPPTVSFTTSAPADLTTLSEGQTGVTLSYLVTSNANGPDDYELALTEVPDANYSGSSFTSGSPTSVGNLGATMAAIDTADFTSLNCLTTAPSDSPATCTISVPNDDASGGTVNGIGVAAGKRILIEGSTDLYCTVTSVGDSTGGDATYTSDPDGAGPLTISMSTVEVEDCTTDFSPTIGIIAGPVTVSAGADMQEAIEVDVILTTGTLTSGSTADTDVTVDGQDVGADGGSTDAILEAGTLTILATDLNVYKYVRNITTAAGNSLAGGTDPYDQIDIDTGNTIEAGVDTYYDELVTAVPGDTLEYVILLRNDGGNIDSVVSSDTIPPFTTLVLAPATNQLRYVPSAVLTPLSCAGVSGTCTLTAPAPTTTTITPTIDDGDAGEIDTSAPTDIIYVYPGTGGDDSTAGVGAGVGGLITSGTVSIIIYQVTIE